MLTPVDAFLLADVFDDALVNEGVEFLGPIAGDEEFAKFFARDGQVAVDDRNDALVVGTRFGFFLLLGLRSGGRGSLARAGRQGGRRHGGEDSQGSKGQARQEDRRAELDFGN